MAQNGVKKIAVVGAESTGKTWLCEALAAHYGCGWVPEYARTYFNDSDIYNYTLSDLEAIAREQVRLEAAALETAGPYLFCDTNLVTLKIWAELEFNTVPPFIAAHLHHSSYTHYFITSNEVPWQADPLRQNKHSRDLLLQLNENEVRRSGIPYSVVRGTDRQRLLNAITTLDSLPHLKR